MASGPPPLRACTSPEGPAARRRKRRARAGGDREASSNLLRSPGWSRMWLLECARKLSLPGTGDTARVEPRELTARGPRPSICWNELEREIGGGAMIARGPVGISLILCIAAAGNVSGQVIIDHSCTWLDQIPDSWILTVRTLDSHYAHTSHGGQLTYGIEFIEADDPFYNSEIGYCVLP